jgi:tetratricopeptide (TPR) repeat protein
MSSMNLLFVADINASAVSLFQRGSHEEAKAMFVEALRRVHIFCLQSECEFIDTDDVQLEGGKLRCFDDTPLNSPFSSSSYSIAPSAERKDVYAQVIYGSAFLLSSDIPLVSDAVTAVLLYNVGLFYHRQGIHSGKSTPYRKAMALYRKSFSLLRRRTDSSALLVLEAAICYNLAHIYQAAFCDTATAQATMRQLVPVVDSMMCSANVQQTDIDFFQNGLTLFSDMTSHYNFSPAA